MNNNLKTATAALNKKSIEKENLEKLEKLAKEIKSTEKIQQTKNSQIQQINHTEVRKNLDRLAASIKKERLNQNLTQKQLGKLSNRSQSTISAAEQMWGTSKYTLLCIANSLGKELIIN